MGIRATAEVEVRGARGVHVGDTAVPEAQYCEQALHYTGTLISHLCNNLLLHKNLVFTSGNCEVMMGCILL